MALQTFAPDVRPELISTARPDAAQKDAAKGAARRAPCVSRPATGSAAQRRAPRAPRAQRPPKPGPPPHCAAPAAQRGGALDRTASQAAACSPQPAARNATSEKLPPSLATKRAALSSDARKVVFPKCQFH